MTGEGEDGQQADAIDWEISWDMPEGTFEAVEWGTAPTLDSVNALGAPDGSPGELRLAEPGALLAPGRRLGEHIQIVSMLDAGGMGEVYLARDLALGRKVAVKVLRHAQAHDPEAHEHRLRLFRRDAAATAQLQHPHIVTIFQIGVEQGLPFMVLEFLRGESLAGRLKRGSLPLPEALVVMEQVALALEHAHEAGVTHRDLKPANIYLRHDGTVKVLDFGVALLKTDRDEIIEAFQKSPEELDAYLGDSPASAGTPLYMAPEQLRGEAQDARVDLWACGVVLYELLTGERPFATPLLAVMRPPPSIKDALPQAPDELDALLARCLTRAVDARMPSARALVEALRQLLDGPRGLRLAVGRAAASETNIGLARDVFVGRQRELRRLESLWTGGERLITLGGPGGTGKTRLAREFGAALVSRFVGGVWFCDLHEARSRDAALVRVASALGVPLGQGDMMATISAALAGRGATLLILDNLEQLGGVAAELLRAWLAAAPQATFITTSRARLGVREEVWLRMGPLDVPERGTISAAEIVASEAVALFTERARAARAGFALDDQSMRDVAELTRLLDGLPLAIELAAARVRMLSPAQLLGRLSRRFDLLQDRRAGGRQATLRATIDWSWELLGPPERAALAALSVFEEGFDADAVEQVVCLDARYDDAPWALELLEALLDQSLVRELPDRPDEAPRFDLLVSVREYAAERLADPQGTPADHGGPFGGPDDVAATERAHAEWCAQLASWEVIEALFLRGHMTIGRLRRERANLRAAWRRACARQWWPLAAQVACALAEVIEQDGPFAAGLEVVDAVAQEGLSPAWRARLLCSRGRLLWRLGELDEAALCFEAAAQVGGDATDPHTQAHLALGLGRVEAERGRPDAAGEAYQRAIDLCQLHHLDRLRGVALGNMAIHIQHRGELDEALSLFGDALQIQRGLGELRQEGVVLANMGVLLFQRGDLDGSERALRRALTLARELDDRRTTTALLGNLSVLERHLNRDAEALALLEQALRLSRELGDRRGEGIGLGNVAHMHRRMGRLDDARRGLSRALEIARQMGDSRWQGYWLSLLAEVEEEQGLLDDARARLDEARDLQETVGDRLNLGLTWCRIGQVELARGDRAAAQAAATDAEALAQHLKAGPDSELRQAVEALRARLLGDRATQGGL